MGLFSAPTPEKEYEKALQAIAAYQKNYNEHQKEKALKHLNNAVAGNHKDALYTYACYISRGHSFWNCIYFGYKDKDFFKEVVAILEKLAAYNDVRAYRDLGTYYYECKDYKNAIVWLEKFEASKTSTNYENLLKCYQEIKDYYKIIDLLTAHQNDSNFNHLLDLAFAYDQTKQEEEAYTCYKKIADWGNIIGITYVARYYLRKGNYVLAYDWFKKAIVMNDYYSKQDVRQMVANNQLKFSDVKAFYESHISNVWAKEQLGLLYANGIGTPKNEALALNYLTQITDLTTVSHEAKTFMGDCFYYGRGTFTNYEKAKKYYYSVALPYGYSDFQPFYAFCDQKYHRYKELAESCYQTKDYKVAVRIYENFLVDKGEPIILDHLGRCYLNGWGTNNNDTKAMELFRKAEKQNYPYSIHVIGWCYAMGRGVPKDQKKALDYYLKAEGLGHLAGSQYNLGIAYEYGQGTSIDYYKALEWYTKAANQKYEKALPRINEVKKAIVQLEETKRKQQEEQEVQNLQNEFDESIKKFNDSVKNLKDAVENFNLSKQKNEETGNIIKTALTSNPGSAKEELDSLIGLENVKQEIRYLENMIKRNKLNEAHGLPTVNVSKHMVFTGNPGTGKTTVARIVARIFKENGLISKGHFIETDSTGLTEGYIRQSSTKTLKVLNQALGGVLFIDEAYNLIPEDSRNDFGVEVVTVINKFMDDHRDDMVIIVAGYEKDMERFINSNEGLRSRFTTRIHFPDYSRDEMQQIFDRFATKDKLVITLEAREKLLSLWEQSTSYKNVGNGRAVRNVYEKVLKLQSNRIIENDLSDINSLITIQEADIPEAKDVFY